MLPLLIAPFVGSFLGVLIERLPRHQPVAWVRSACPACGATLGPLDLVPLLSFALLRGRCRHCGQPIGWFHPAIELAALGVALWALLVGETEQDVWISCLLGWTLLPLAWIDAVWLLLPDVLTLPLVLCGLAVTLVTTPDEVLWHAIGAASGYLAILGIALGYRALRGREGLGMGDAKLLAAAGAWLGVTLLPWVVLLAAMAALLFAGIAAIAGRSVQATTVLPFGPFLAASIWLLWLYGAALA